MRSCLFGLLALTTPYAILSASGERMKVRGGSAREGVPG